MWPFLLPPSFLLLSFLLPLREVEAEGEACHVAVFLW
jgi:hypothetical protein